MRMTVCLRDTTVRRPARVPDTRVIAAEFVGIGFDFEVSDLADRLDDFDFFIVIDDTDACRIVATIFEALESCEDFF